MNYLEVLSSQILDADAMLKADGRTTWDLCLFGGGTGYRVGRFALNVSFQEGIITQLLV